MLSFTSPCKVLFPLLTLLLVACGGGGSLVKDTPKTTPPVVNPPVVKEPETPVEGCQNEKYSIVSVSDDGTFDGDYLPKNVIDGDTSPSSRWSSLGTNSVLTLDLGSENLIGSLKIKWHQGATRQANFEVQTSPDNNTWREVLKEGISSGKHSGFEQVDLTASEGRYIQILGLGNTQNDWNSIVEVEAHSCEGADGQIIADFPNELGIELVDWYLSVPTDEDNNGKSDSISESELAAGYTNSEYFYASADGGIVMRSPSYGFKTSTNTKYVRVELREMLRRGNKSHKTQGVNKNNWVFGSTSGTAQANAGGVDGELNVSLAVNQVTTTGENYQIGRVVIGQIHANDDEPIRLYYRKLPNNINGSIYFAHESRVDNADEVYIEMLGSKDNSASNPTDGIALNERFSYRIKVELDLLTVTIIREGKDDVVATHNMAGSLYDEDDQYQYFKVGVYQGNNSSAEDEYVQATFYEIRNSHTGYAHSE